MFDDMYTRLISKAPYRTLIFIPIAVAVLMGLVWGVQVIDGTLPMGIDFKGGAKMIISIKEINFDEKKLDGELNALGLENLKLDIGDDRAAGVKRLGIETTSSDSFVNERGALEVIEKYTGKLNEYDAASIRLKEEPSKDTMEKLEKRFKGADVEFNSSTNTLRITAMNIDENDVKSGLNYYFKDIDTQNIVVERANLLYHPVSPTMGEAFKRQGALALFAAYLLMSLVVFVVFRALVPAGAVILAATCDIIIAAGGMSILGIELQPASMAALLMLIGYSVDSDILLTTRVLKGKAEEVDSRIDDAMKTGLTMTFTTLFALTALLIVSSYLAQIALLTSIASVLLVGLLADIFTTWFMNAGILKWYLSQPKKRKRRSRFRVQIFSK